MLGERLVKLRKEKDISQFELSDYMHVTQQTLSKWEHGVNQPDNESLIKLAKYFNVSVDYLLGNSESRDNLQPYEDELEKVLFSKAKDLSDTDKMAVIGVIDAIKKDVDKELDK